jgi:glycosyltransferase involved in cell wall biosynthesis
MNEPIHRAIVYATRPAMTTVPGLRVAFATARYPPYVGGVELHSAEVASRLVARGVEVTVLTTDVSGELPPFEVRDGVTIRRFAAWPRGRDWYLSPGLYREISRVGWDLVHVQGFQTFVAPGAMLAASLARVPYVLTFHQGGHASRFRRRRVPFQESALRPLLARADRLVALTPFEADDRSRRLRLPRTRFVVVPNGHDLPAPSAGSERDPDLIASPGRLVRNKGHHRVISALPHIIPSRPGVRLWIMGSGPEEAKLQRLAADLGVADRVEIEAIPIHDRQRIADELARVQVAVSMSEFEAHGIAVLEALGAGCRAIVARAAGLSVLVDEGLARGVPLDSSPKQLADAILEELDEPLPPAPPHLRTWDDCADRLLQVYQEVVRERPSKKDQTSPSSH